MNALVIEDNPSDFALLQGMLQRSMDPSFTVQAAGTLADGLTLLRKNFVDVVLLDLGLPDSQGADGVRAILDMAPATPVVVITAEDSEDSAMAALREGAQDYVVKGQVTITLILRSIRYAVERSRFEWKIQEESRRRKELERIVNQSPAVAFVWGYDQGWTVGYVSGNVSQFGYAARDLLEQQVGFLSFVHEEDRRRIMREVETYMKEGQNAFSQEYRIVTKKGEVRWVNAWAWIRRDRDETVSCLEGVILDVTERRNLEIAVMDVSGQEQQRIGQDLHDGLGQHLTGLALQCKVLQQKLVADGVPAAQDIATLATSINEAITRTHRLAQGLNPVGLDSEGLLIALEGMASNISYMYNIQCTCACEAPQIFEHCKAATQLYWIAHEAVYNAVKYSKARSIRIALGGEGTSRWLHVEDDGIGIKKEPCATGRMGLHIMRSRAKMLGGNLDVTSKKNGGTRVTCAYHTDGA
ncbi:MAG: response regulator [Spartobacteria bacterium]|nr:response regulator [Spartobacteria bacterium]